MGTSRSISVEDPDAVRRNMQRLRDVVAGLPSSAEIQKLGGSTSYYAMNFTMPLWSRANELSMVTRQLADRLVELAAQVDKTVDVLVKADQEAEEQARRLQNELPAGLVAIPPVPVVVRQELPSFALPNGG